METTGIIGCTGCGLPIADGYSMGCRTCADRREAHHRLKLAQEPRVVEYRILVAEYGNKMSERVDALLPEWQPLGGAVPSNGKFIQTMVRYG